MTGTMDLNAWFRQNGRTDAAEKKLRAALERAPLAQDGSRAADELLRPQRLVLPKLDDAALPDFMGDVVRELTRDTEAHPVAVASTLLSAAGNAIGDRPYRQVGNDRHTAKLFHVLVGPTDLGRKGHASGLVYGVMREADPFWTDERVTSGIESGQGLIDRAARSVDDAEGAGDGRLFIEAGEFVSILKACNMKGSNLSDKLREAYDDRPLRNTRARQESVIVKRHHISLVGNITPAELRQFTTDISMANGLLNRFSFFLVERTRPIPRPKARDYSALAKDLEKVLKSARRREELKWSRRAGAMWDAWYLSVRERPGLAGAMTSRRPARLLRMIVAYTLLDPESPPIRSKHFEAGLALLDYADKSVRAIYGDRTGDRIGDRILVELREAFPGVVAQSELGEALGGHVPGVKLEEEVGKLVDLGLADRSKIQTRGRSRIDVVALPW